MIFLDYQVYIIGGDGTQKGAAAIYKVVVEILFAAYFVVI